MAYASPVAALTLSLTGKFSRQGKDAEQAVRLWAAASAAQLLLIDDTSTRSTAVRAYAEFLQRRNVNLLLGPYSSGLTRAVLPLAHQSRQLLWNHGGSANDLMRPGVATLLTPASRYFDGTLEVARKRTVDLVLVVPGSGPFARSVAEGALTRASRIGIPARRVDVNALPNEDAPGLAVLTAGQFEHDVDVVTRLHTWRHRPVLVGAVAAGIPAFEQAVGPEIAEGVLAPLHWWPSPGTPEIGPSGTEFADVYRRRVGREPTYVAAQMAAAGYLAEAARQQGLSAADILRWRTSTLLGDFALSSDWVQVGHRMTTAQWGEGSMIPL